MNHICLLGRLCADPAMIEVGDKGKVTKFTLAVDRPLSKEVREKAKRTVDFIPCTCWGKKAELINEYFKKGDKIGVEGRIRVDNYENSNGEKVYSTYVNVSEFDFTDKTKNNKETEKESIFDEGDLPF